jgi:hypothetical protein
MSPGCVFAVASSRGPGKASHCQISTSCRIEAMIKVGLLCLWQKAMPRSETKYWEAIAFEVIIYFCKYMS